MRNPKTEGFVLVLVIVALGLVGVVMLVLTEGANTMLFHADRAYLEAVERNLTASGLAWARQQAVQSDAAASAVSTELDVTRLKGPQAALTVSFTSVESAAATVQVGTRCAKGRHIFQTSDEHTLNLAR
jgi:hypothetical protein